MPKVTTYETKALTADGTSQLMKFPIYYLPKRSKFVMEVPEHYGQLSKEDKDWELIQNEKVICKLRRISRRTTGTYGVETSWHLMSDKENVLISALHSLIADYKKWLVARKQLKKYIFIEVDFSLTTDEWVQKNAIDFKYEIIFKMSDEDRYFYDEKGKGIGHQRVFGRDTTIVIPHTPQREKFFKAFDANLFKLITQIKQFMDLIKEDHTKLESSVKLLQFNSEKKKLKRRGYD